MEKIALDDWEWMIEVDENSALTTFTLRSGGTMGVKNGMMTLIKDSLLDESCKWMIKCVDENYFKIYNENGIKSNYNHVGGIV